MTARPRTPGARAARYAVVAAAVAVLAVAVVLGSALLGGDRPEEGIARTFLERLFAGQGHRAHELTTPAYRSLVRPDDLEALAGALADAAGGRFELDILGSERTPGSAPRESLVGYRAATAVGPVAGVVTLFEVDGGWRVADVGYDFTEGDREQVEAVRTVTRRLNQQVEERARRLERPAGGTPVGTASPR